SLSIVALAMAGFTRDLHIRQKMHLENFHSRPLASPTTPPLYIKRKTSWLAAPYFSLRQFDEKCPSIGKHAGICRWIGTWSSSNRTLVDFNDFINMFQAFNLFERHRLRFRTKEMLVQNRIKRSCNQAGFTRARHAGHKD